MLADDDATEASVDLSQGVIVFGHELLLMHELGPEGDYTVE